MLCHSVAAPGADMPAIALVLALCDRWAAAVPLAPDHDDGSAQLKFVGVDPCILAICSCRCVQQGCVAPGGHGDTGLLRTLPMCLQKAASAAALCSIVKTRPWCENSCSSKTAGSSAVSCTLASRAAVHTVSGMHGTYGSSSRGTASRRAARASGRAASDSARSTRAHRERPARRPLPSLRISASSYFCHAGAGLANNPQITRWTRGERKRRRDGVRGRRCEESKRARARAACRACVRTAYAAGPSPNVVLEAHGVRCWSAKRTAYAAGPRSNLVLEQVRVVGLQKAAHHNGKVGKISRRKADAPDRVGIDLDGGESLAVRRENLELVTPPEKRAKVDAEAHRTLKRDDAILREFHGSGDPDLLVLYYHLRDRSFDGFNATEYNTQMLRYYESGMSVVCVVPRRIQATNLFLVCLQHKQHELNSLCELAFQCMRQFCGISMLAKKRCFVCQKPDAEFCKCKVACFCSESCKSSAPWHSKLCKIVQKSAIAVEDECLQLL